MCLQNWKLRCEGGLLAPCILRESGEPAAAFKNSGSIPGTNTEASLKTPVADKMLDYGLRRSPEPWGEPALMQPW